MRASTLAAWFSAASVIACASGGGSRSPSETADPPAIADASLRMIGSDTTWMVRGPGYELVARTVRDLALVWPALDGQARLLREMFSTDPAEVVAVVKHLSSDGSRGPAVPLTVDSRSTVVEVYVGDVLSERDGRAARAARGRTPPPGGAISGIMGRFAPGSATQHVLRAWLAAHAGALTSSPATARALAGDAPDPRVKPWVEDAIAGASADSQLTDRLVAQLAAQKDSLYPLDQFFLMERPASVQPPRSEGMGRRGGDAGGMGGRGGMGGAGRGGMGGRGSMGGGMGSGRGGSGENPMVRPTVLQGAALFSAQAMTFGRYLVTRESAAFLGAIVNGQIKDVPINNVLTSATRIHARDLERLELDWRRWLEVRARAVRR